MAKPIKTYDPALVALTDAELEHEIGKYLATGWLPQSKNLSEIVDRDIEIRKIAEGKENNNGRFDLYQELERLKKGKNRHLYRVLLYYINKNKPITDALGRSENRRHKDRNTDTLVSVATDVQQHAVPKVGLGGFRDSFIEAANDARAVAARAVDDKVFAAALGFAFAEKGIGLSLPDQTDVSEPPAGFASAWGQAAALATASELALPDQAPRLWADRDPKTERNPAEFIRLTYHHWLKHRVLRRQDVGQLDDALGKAYSQWIRPERHPGDAIDFAPGNPGGKIEDPKEAIERRRESTRKAVARHRANKTARTPSQP